MTRCRTALLLVVALVFIAACAHTKKSTDPVYATYGVREYWIVDAEERQIQIHSLTDSGWVLAQNGVPGAEIASTILEGLRFDPARLFEQ